MRNEHLSDLERFGFKQRKDGSLIYRDKEEKRDALSYKMQSVGNCPPVAPVGWWYSDYALDSIKRYRGVVSAGECVAGRNAS